MTRLGRILACGLCAGSLGALCGCDAALKPAAERTRVSAETGRAAFPPVAISIHPLSRLSRDGAGGALRIEAHVELVDAFDHLVKSVGAFTFEAATPDGRALTLADETPLRWRIDARTPASASAPFDPLTRTFRFVLKDISPGFKGETLLLRASFLRPDGTRLDAERTIRLESARIVP